MSNPDAGEVERLAEKLDRLVHPEISKYSGFHELPEDEQREFESAAAYVLTLVTPLVEAARKVCAEGCDCRTNCNHEALLKPLDDALAHWNQAGLDKEGRG